MKALRADFDALNMELYERFLEHVSLRPGISHKEALDYFSMIQDMVNCYFCSPSFQSSDFPDVMTAHEVNLAKLLDYMLYGIAERRDEI